MMPDICPVCTRIWRPGQHSILCKSCEGWVHHNNRNKCSGLTTVEFDRHSNDLDKPWICDICIAKNNYKIFSFLPFIDVVVDNKVIPYASNILSSALVNHKDFISKCNSGNNPTFEYDDTDNVSSTVNSLEIDLPSSFGALHVNIASLDNHIDNLRLILSLLNYNFDVIGISEHKIKIHFLLIILLYLATRNSNLNLLEQYMVVPVFTPKRVLTI